jgi:uncharacterized OsmC-like protein
MQTLSAPITENIRRNGVDVAALRETIAAVKASPSLGEFKFRATNQWEDGSRNLATVRDFHGTDAEHAHQETMHVRMDEPPVLLGQDTGLNPVEVLLSALSGCMTTSLAYQAANLGLDIESIDSEYEGDIDLKGFLGIDPKVRNGFQEIRVKFRVKGDATAEQIRELVAKSPVFDTISNPVAVKVEVVTA